MSQVWTGDALVLLVVERLGTLLHSSALGPISMLVLGQHVCTWSETLGSNVMFDVTTDGCGVRLGVVMVSVEASDMVLHVLRIVLVIKTSCKLFKVALPSLLLRELSTLGVF